MEEEEEEAAAPAAAAARRYGWIVVVKRRGGSSSGKFQVASPPDLLIYHVPAWLSYVSNVECRLISYLCTIKYQAVYPHSLNVYCMPASL